MLVRKVLSYIIPFMTYCGKRCMLPCGMPWNYKPPTLMFRSATRGTIFSSMQPGVEQRQGIVCTVKSLNPIPQRDDRFTILAEALVPRGL